MLMKSSDDTVMGCLEQEWHLSGTEMQGNNPVWLIVFVALGMGLATSGILEDSSRSRRQRMGIVVLGCSLILIGCMLL
jgi:hypothetical protein